MKDILLKRLLESIPVLFLVSVFCFAIIHAAPGDPMDMYIINNDNMTEEQIEELREDLGLNGTVVEQYFSWLKNIIKGEFGISVVNKQPVIRLIGDRLPNTILLMATSMVLSLVISIPLGLIAGYHKNKFIDNLIGFTCYIGISIPTFWLGFMLLIVFSLRLAWFPSGGMHSIGNESLGDTLLHLVLPSVVLSLNNIAVYIRYIRSNTISQLEEDYVLTAKSKGDNSKKILFYEVLKNCLLPVITIAGMNFGTIVTGSFVVESVFGWPGMGTLALSAIGTRDYPLVMGCTMLSCLILVIGNIMADILYGFADPRIKQGVKK